MESEDPRRTQVKISIGVLCQSLGEETELGHSFRGILAFGTEAMGVDETARESISDEKRTTHRILNDRNREDLGGVVEPEGMGKKMHSKMEDWAIC